MDQTGHQNRPSGRPIQTTNGEDHQPDVPGGSPAWISPELIGDTIRIWQPYYPETLTPAIALDMLIVTGYLFDALGHSTGVAS